MAVAIDTLGAIREYLEGVAGRADHHAQNVADIALTLAGAVFLVSTGEIEVRTHKGETANMMWFYVGPQRYALAYNHKTESIELRERSRDGAVLHSFTNATPPSEVRRIFMGL